MKRRVVIAGAGLAGLFAAAALAQRGCAVTVIERAQALGEAGAGIQISPNGARLLARIGALDA
ncbi:MAG: salicylate hydroxylase, partial [Rhodobacterales bacterium CG_4_10_14_0_8_um_filter_70_9]